MKRVFLAVPVGQEPAIGQFYDKIRAGLAEEKIKWVRPENLHLTLHFFGDLEEEDIARVDRLFGQFLTLLPAFGLSFRGVGVFPGLQRPRVLWVGTEPAALLDRLAETVEEVLIEGDFDLPDKPFSPHLTIGRIKWIGDRKKFAEVITDNRDVPVTRLPVNEIHLLESILRPEGPEYRVLHSYGLKG